MINTLIVIYRANPFRPHCGNCRHVWLCRFLGLNVAGIEDGPRCGDFDG